ncbi:MAG TPA: hypothetical protein VFH17_08385 [Coriobacteriia bacterium]|nr:hypothetical protein [Coriobacteriia bacterium]
MTDATGLFLQTAGAGRSARAASLVGGELAKLAPGYVGPVEFTDAEGKPVTLLVSQAAELRADRLLIVHDQGASLIDMGTGAMLDVPTPARLDLARTTADHVYYVAGNSLHRVALEDGADLLMSGDADIPGPSRLYVTPSGAVFSGHATSVPAGRRYWVSYPDATPPLDLSSDGNAILFFEGLAGFVIEHAGTLYQIRDMGMQLGATEITLDPDGPLYVSPGTEAVCDSAGPYYAWTRLAENLYTDDAHIYRFAGTIITSYPQTAEVSSGAWLPDAKVDGDALYIGWDAGGTLKVRALDLAAAGAQTALLDEPAASDYAVVAGSIFYVKADGTWRKDITTGTVSKYSDTPAEIEAVR